MRTKVEKNKLPNNSHKCVHYMYVKEDVKVRVYGIMKWNLILKKILRDFRVYHQF